MASFVHITLESNARRIRTAGIGRLRRVGRSGERGVFAVPVVENFALTHQWVRELRRRQRGLLVAVYFRVGDHETVTLGHYGQPPRTLTAAEAVHEFESAVDAWGWETIIPRRIEPREITRIAHVPQIVGWRFSPKAKGHPPFCPCKFCTRGEWGASRLRRKYGESG